MKNNLADRIAKLTPEQRALFEASLRAKNMKADKILPKEGSIPRRGHKNPSPLTVDQERLWFFHQMNPDKPTYNVYGAIRLEGRLDIDAMEFAINEVLRRHESWRTTFDLIDGQPVQIVHDELQLKFDVADVRDLPEEEREPAAHQETLDEVMIPIDLVNGPVVRVKLIRISETQNIIVLTVHHLVTDRVTFSIVFQELVQHYIARVQGQPSRLPEPAIQYADYAEWQREYLQGETRERLMNYWKNYLDGSDFVLNLPTDFPRPPVQSYKGARHFFELPKELGDRLKALGTKEGATPFMTLMASFKALLYRYTGQEDIILGTPLANRDKPEMERVLGYFLTSGVFRTLVEGRLSFRELLARVRENTLGAFEHSGMPFGLLLDELKPKRDLSRNPLFQAMFVYVDVPEVPMQFPDLKISYELIDGETAKYDIVFGLIDRDGIVDREYGTECFFEYSPDLFRPETIALMAEHWVLLIEEFLAAPDTPLGDLPMLTAAEKACILGEWNDTRMETDADLLAYELIEAQAALRPDAPALDFEGQIVTYRELNEKANRLARHLQRQGVRPDSIVGLCVERSPEFVIGLLAVLKAGGAYLPLDTIYPDERIAFMLQDAGVQLVLTQTALQSRVETLAPQVRTIPLDAADELLAVQSTENLTRTAEPEHLAYIIYTSGSTGQPKGAMIEHRNLANFASVLPGQIGVGVEDRTLQFASISFDASALEIYSSLTVGGTLVMARRESLIPGQPLAEFLRTQRVTTVALTPSVLHLLPAADLPDLRTVLAIGEACTVEAVARWAPHCSFYNAYGPTETTILSHLALATDTTRIPPIGRPIPNMRGYILDSHGQLVPVGVPGELHIGGAGVSRGYLNRPDLNAAAFLADPFSSQPGARLYKTGDLVRWLPSGEVEYLGRIDHQVKVRGYRIELSEVEARIAEHPQVREIAAIAKPDASGSHRLIACIVTHDSALTAGEMRLFLKDRLPEFMVPSAFVFFDRFPLNRNGKVDRKALLDMDNLLINSEESYVAPRHEIDEVLAKIWSELLEIERVGIDDHFFDLGGHSLLATQMVSRVRETFQVDVPMDQLLAAGTIAGVADALVRHEKVPGQIEKIARVRKKLDAMSPEQVAALLAAKKGGQA